MKHKEKYGAVSNLRYVYGDIIRSDKFLFLIIILGIISGVLLPLAGIYVPKTAVEAVQGAHAADSFKTFAFLIGASALLRIIQNFYSHIIDIRISTFQNVYLKRLLHKYLTCNYKIIESEDGQEQYRKALNAVTTGSSYGSGIPCMLHASINLTIRLLDIAIYISMLAGLNIWIAAIITVFSAMDALALRKARNYETTRRDEFGKCLKKSAYLERAAADTAAGKDLRIFNMRGRFAALWDRTIAEMKSVLWACKRRHADADAE